MKQNQSEILSASILIVDDQPANVELLAQLLADTGYTRTTCLTNPHEVCAAYRANPHDLILLDLKMPGMDGFEVMQALAADEPGTILPVIVLTAEPGHKLRALQAGARDFISKPFEVAEVRTRIHNMLETRLLYKKLAEQNRMLEQRVLERTSELASSESRFRSLTELASDWYWEQNVTGDFTTVSGPVFEMLGIGFGNFLSDRGADYVAFRTSGWNEEERAELQSKIALREPFLDFPFTRINVDGTTQNFRVSGEPMFDGSCQFTGYRGIGAEILTRQ